MKARSTATAAVAGLALAAALLTMAATSPAAPSAPLYPDIVEEIPHHLNIQNTQQREWLRYSTTHINLGQGGLQIRGGGQVAPCVIDGVAFDQCTHATQEILDSNGTIVSTHPAGVALFHPEHNHWHQNAVAEFKIMKGDPEDGTEMAHGFKATFCLVDVKFTGITGQQKKAAPRTYFDCNEALQGIAVGWADQYHHSTPDQELDITGLKAGVYFLTHLADPDDHWLEGPAADSPGEKNNFAWVKFKLTRTGANPEVTVLGHSPCEGVACGFGGNP